MIRIEFETGAVLELDREHLVGADLRGLSLPRALLGKLNLSRANLREVDLRSASLE
ncbi:pentapeptide repeat-containing protein [Myxococcus fulvus]|uniref:pentapeptide repeat-containing protein n=1 Tax=Myxococcus fulvus TaxID=33 RepID=UPI003B9CA7DB